MRIDGLPQPNRVSQANSRNDAVRSKKDSDRSGDVVEISGGLQDVAELSSKAVNAPEEANPRIDEIKERVRSGYYDSAEAKQQIADALLESDSLRGTVKDIEANRSVKQQLDQVPDTRPERVEQAKQRLEDGYYDSPEVRRETGERLLDHLM